MSAEMSIEELQKLEVLTVGQVCRLLQCDRRMITDLCNRWTASRGRSGLSFFMLGKTEKRFRREAVFACVGKLEREVWD